MSESTNRDVATLPGLPTPPDLRRALSIYVAARRRAVGPERKRQLVGEEKTGGRREAALPRVAVARPPDARRVPVPERLDFHRSAELWRDGPRPGGRRGGGGG